MSTANQAETMPVQPKKPRFYYGWIIVVVSALTDFVSFGAGNNSLGVFLRPMSESLGWSRTLFTGAATLQSLGNVMISPIVGPAHRPARPPLDYAHRRSYSRDKLQPYGQDHRALAVLHSLHGGHRTGP